MERFGRSVLAAAKGEPTPEDGYARPATSTSSRAACSSSGPTCSTLDDEAQLTTARDLAYDFQLAELQSSLEKFHVHFDVWFSERMLHDTPAHGGPSLVDEAVDRLRAQGHVYDEDGAVWVRTTDFGDDRDRVIRRANGVYTYFAADAAYYLNKSDRGFHHKIYLLGADHHGYVHRLKALAGAAGDDPDKDVEVLIGQLVSINGARLSKRAGNIIEMDDLREWLGADALRYSLARYPADSPPRRSTPSCCASARTTTRSSTCSTRTPAPTTWRATPRHPMSSARSSHRSCSPTRPSRRFSARSRSSRGSSRSPPRCASRTASRATSRSSPGSTTAGTTTAG